MKRRIVSVLLACVMISASVTLTGCGESADNKENAESEVDEDIIEVEVVNPVTGNIEVSTQFMGTLEMKDETEVFPMASGKITDTFFNVGDYVNEGDILFTIDDEAAKLQLQNAQATYTTAKVGAQQQIGALQMKRDSNVDTVQTAQEGISKVQDSFNYMEEKYGDVEEKKQDLEDDKHDLKKDLKKINDKIKKAKNELEDELTRGDSAAAEETTKQIASLQAQKNSIESGIDSYESTIDTLESSEKEINYNKSQLYYSYNQAVRGEHLAQENLEYYDQYTAPGTIESSQASLQQAQVAVDSAKLQLDNTKVTSPVSGVVKTKNVDKFGMAQAGYTAYVITNDDTILADFYVTESVYKNLTMGQEIVIERNGEEYTGKISELAENIDPMKNLFEIKAEVVGNVDALSSGTAVKISAVTDRASNAMTIPVDCVYYESDKAYVYTEEGGVLKKTFVEIGIFNDEQMQIVSGLTPESVVVSSWSSELRDGLKVTTTDANKTNDDETTAGSADTKE